MSYSIPGSTKILTLATSPFLITLVGALSVYGTRSVHFTVAPGKRYILLPEIIDVHIQLHNYQKDLKVL